MKDMRALVVKYEVQLKGTTFKCAYIFTYLNLLRLYSGNIKANYLNTLYFYTYNMMIIASHTI